MPGTCTDGVDLLNALPCPARPTSFHVELDLMRRLFQPVQPSVRLHRESET